MSAAEELTLAAERLEAGHVYMHVDVAESLAAWLRTEAAYVQYGDRDGRSAPALAREIIRATGGTP